MSRIKTRAYLLEAGVLPKEEAEKLPPSSAEDYFPCELGDEELLLLKEAAAKMKAQFSNDLSAIDLDDTLIGFIHSLEAFPLTASVLTLPTGI